MAKFKVSVSIEAKSANDALAMCSLFQSVASKIDYADLMKILKTAHEKPSVVKTALKFI